MAQYWEATRDVISMHMSLPATTDMRSWPTMQGQAGRQAAELRTRPRIRERDTGTKHTVGGDGGGGDKGRKLAYDRQLPQGLLSCILCGGGLVRYVLLLLIRPGQSEPLHRTSDWK